MSALSQKRTLQCILVMSALPHCTAHGMRKAFLRRMAEAGCSEDYIASISGHRDMREIRKYGQCLRHALGRHPRPVGGLHSISLRPERERRDRGDCQLEGLESANFCRKAVIWAFLGGDGRSGGTRTRNPRFWRPVL